MTKKHYPPAIARYREKNPSIGVRLPVGQRDALDKICQENKVTKSKFIHDLFVRGLDAVKDIKIAADKTLADENGRLQDVIEIQDGDIMALEDEVKRWRKSAQGETEHLNLIHDLTLQLHNISQDNSKQKAIIDAIKDAVKEGRRSGNYMVFYEAINVMF